MTYTLNKTGAEIDDLLVKAGTAAQASDLTALETQIETTIDTEVGAVEDLIGDLTGLSTTEQGSVVGAINELFQSASDGKTAIAAAITGEGVKAAAEDSYSTLATKIGQIRGGWLEPLVQNGDSIEPTGTYATSTYYNTTYGVKIGYVANGDILLSMQGGTTTSYENLHFTLTSAPTGVTLTASSSSWDTSNPAGQLYVCVLSGIAAQVEIDIEMASYNSTYDYTTCAITVTEV